MREERCTTNMGRDISWAGEPDRIENQLKMTAYPISVVLGWLPLPRFLFK